MFPHFPWIPVGQPLGSQSHEWLHCVQQTFVESLHFQPYELWRVQKQTKLDPEPFLWGQETSEGGRLIFFVEQWHLQELAGANSRLYATLASGQQFKGNRRTCRSILSGEVGGQTPLVTRCAGHCHPLGPEHQ